MAAASTTILGIETSCDETAVAVVRRHRNGHGNGHRDGQANTQGAVWGEILSNVVLSQVKDHAPYGGVVPEVAARAHLAHIAALAQQAIRESGATPDAVAATTGPGLIGGLLVGSGFGKGFALARGLPFVAVNHLEGHALTPRLLGKCDFPYLLLLISGGHTQFQRVKGVGDYQRLGTTIDDALGEAFDKTAKLLGLGYPGGPQVEIWARRGTAARFSLPRPLKGRDDCNFSFSGLKTAVREVVRGLGTLRDADRADLCASFELAVAETVADRLHRAMALFHEGHPDVKQPTLVVSGGVAANAALRTMFETVCAENGFRLVVPPIHLCTDNAAMIAWAGAERLAQGLTDGLDVAARARWPLDQAAAALVGHGRLGGKA